MPATISLTIALLLQEPMTIELGKPVGGFVGPDAKAVHTPHLDENFTTAQTVGVTYYFSAPEDGFYFFDLNSYEFDAYLVLLDSSGGVQAEDNNGQVGTQSRISVELQKGQTCQLVASALFGGRGKFELGANKGAPPQLSEAEYWEATKQDWQQQVSYLEAEYGPDSENLAVACYLIGTQYRNKQFLPEARQHFQRTLDILEDKFGPQHPTVGIIFRELGAVTYDLGDFKASCAHYEKALVARELAMGPDHPEVANILKILGNAYGKIGDYEQAKVHLGESLVRHEKILGKEHADVASILNQLAENLHKLGEYDESRLSYERALKIREAAFGPDDVYVAATLNNLANLHSELGEFATARSMLERSLEIRVKAYGPDDITIAVSLANLSALLDSQGNYEEALPLVKRALGIVIKIQGESGADVGVLKNNQGSLLSRMGRYEEARILLDDAIVLLEGTLGIRHPNLVEPLTNLARVLNLLGNYEEAGSRFRRALAIAEATLNPGHPKISLSTQNLAYFLQGQGEFGEARKLYEAALAQWGPNNLGRADLLNNLAILSIQEGKFDEAVGLSAQSLELHESIYGSSNVKLAYTLVSLASAYFETGDLEKAESACRRALNLRREALGPDHPEVASTMDSLAFLLAQGGGISEAYQLRLQSLKASLRHLGQQLPTMTEAGRLQFLQVSANPNDLIQASLQYPDSNYAEVYSVFQSWKGNATRLQTASVQLRQAGDTEESRKLKGQIQAVSKQLAALVFLPLNEREAGHAEQIDELRSQRLQLERQLNLKLGLQAALAIPSLAEVQSCLPEDSVLVDFFVGNEVYAWIVKPTGEPQLISLGESQSMRTAQSAFLLKSSTRGGRSLTGKEADPAEEYFSRLWLPIAEVIGEAQTVFICPDGFLCELPFGILQQPDETFLLEKHRFSYLSDPTRPARFGQDSSGSEGAILAVGGVNYFRRGEVDVAELSGSSSSRSRIGGSWNSLPATREELRAIADLHEYVLEWKSPLIVVEGKAAAEERVRAELKGKRYVHIATHGYFEPDHLPSLLLDAETKQAQAQLGEQIHAVGLLPGLLSGLVFAGVNGEPDPTRDDGYLSAEEIQHLDLSACDLVVLSACETALGSARAGEGLMSLRRAFSVAGADTVVSSLWKVDDQATAELMKEFYTNLWQKKLGRGEALHQAKLRMLRRNRVENGGDAMPSTWGAFVLSGNWN